MWQLMKTVLGPGGVRFCIDTSQFICSLAMATLKDSITDMLTPKPTALIPVANGCEEMEVAGLVAVLARGGVRVTVADVDGDEDHVVKLANGMEIQADKKLRSCVEELFDIIVVPGGAGAKTLSHCALLTTMLQGQKASGRWFGGICAGVVDVLYHHALVTGPLTTYPAYADRVGDLYREQPVVVSENCVTSQGPATAIAMGLTLLERVRGANIAREVAKSMLCGHKLA